MEIGGVDIVIRHPKGTDLTADFEAALGRLWPHMVIENEADEDGWHLFYYADEAAQTSWNELGCTEANADKMVYLLPRETETTVVLDGLKDEFRTLLDGLCAARSLSHELAFEGLCVADIGTPLTGGSHE